MKAITCCKCGDRLLNQDVAMNLKLLGRQIGVVYCVACLARHLGAREDQLRERQRQYMQTGCSLFARRYTD